MIRIDEIYYNVFVAAFQERRNTSLHWFDPFGSTNFHDLCNFPSVVPAGKRLLFWDQEPIYHDIIWSFFDQFQSVFDGPITIITSERGNQTIKAVCDTYQAEHDYYFFHGWAALDWYRGYDRSFLYQPWIKRSFDHSFICPNNIIGGKRTHRVRLFAELCKRNIVEGNLISFPEICPYEKQSASQIVRDLGLDTNITRWLPRVIDRQHDHANQSHRIDFWEPACKTFCHVVTETVYTSDHLHLSEKTFKPIVMQQPFVLLAPMGSLAYLRSYGFKTFSDIWDESYDIEADDMMRITKVADLLQEVNSWSTAQKKEAQHQIDTTVMHNFRWFYGGFEQLLWQELLGLISRC